jgi:hypothetical protein
MGHLRVLKDERPKVTAAAQASARNIQKPCQNAVFARRGMTANKRPRLPTWRLSRRPMTKVPFVIPRSRPMLVLIRATTNARQEIENATSFREIRVCQSSPERSPGTPSSNASTYAIADGMRSPEAIPVPRKLHYQDQL